VHEVAKIFLTFKYSYLLFPNPAHKTKTVTANWWEATNSKPPRLIIMIGQSEKGTAVRSRSFLAYVRLCCALYQPEQAAQECWAKTILLNQTSMD
jgi:hypothetical protein